MGQKSITQNVFVFAAIDVGDKSKFWNLARIKIKAPFVSICDDFNILIISIMKWSWPRSSITITPGAEIFIWWRFYSGTFGLKGFGNSTHLIICIHLSTSLVIAARKCLAWFWLVSVNLFWVLSWLPMKLQVAAKNMKIELKSLLILEINSFFSVSILQIVVILDGK